MPERFKNLKITSILTHFTYILIIFAIFPKESTQQTLISKTADVQGLCIFSYRNNRYHCDLFNVNITSRFDTLGIIGDHLPGHTNDNVTSVIFQNGEVRFLNSELMKNFRNLEFLDITNKRLEEITENAFENCGRLQEIIIWFNPLNSFMNGTFRNCLNLRIFTAIFLRLKSIPGDLFGSNSNLEEFTITFNELTSFPEELLQNMSRLRGLHIDGNYLTNLSSNFLANVVNLESFNIWQNRFTDPVPIMNIMNRHRNLKEIYIGENPFTSFNVSFFANFQQLQRLWIGSTTGIRLTNILWQSFPRSLVELKVDGIGEEIPENSFNLLTNLQSLEISGSGIVSLQSNTFRSLPQLLKLSIQNTGIRVLNPQIFIGLVNLSDLNLSNNLIEELPFEVFGPLRNLGTQDRRHGIRIAANQLQRLNSNSFGRHPFVSSMSFERNRINAIERGIFSRFNSTITEADFRSNLCINLTFNSSTNLDFFGDFETCYRNWEAPNITTPLTTVTELPTTSTTPDGCGSNFRKFEVFVIILIGFVTVLMNFMK